MTVTQMHNWNRFIRENGWAAGVVADECVGAPLPPACGDKSDVDCRWEGGDRGGASISSGYDDNGDDPIVIIPTPLWIDRTDGDSGDVCDDRLRRLRPDDVRRSRRLGFLLLLELLLMLMLAGLLIGTAQDSCRSHFLRPCVSSDNDHDDNGRGSINNFLNLPIQVVRNPHTRTRQAETVPFYV